MSRLLALTLYAALAGAAPAQARKPAEAGPAALDEAATQSVLRGFAAAEGWSLQAIALLSLGTDWHPCGSDALLQALQGQDLRLRPFAIEQLRRTDTRVFASVCTPALVRQLVEHQLQAKNDLVRHRTLELLQRLAGDAAADAAAIRRWWRQHEHDYAPPPWTPKPTAAAAGPNHTVAAQLVARAFDLRDAGLEVAIAIDSTGSMQVAIDAARDAIVDIVAMLASITPKLKLGLVHYKDLGDFSDGARLLEPLTRDQDKVRDRLAHLTAAGGGGMPEKVDAGIDVALSKAMGWSKDANRLILVVGDAPPHDEDMATLLATVERANRDPFADPKHPTTGPKPQQPLRPFIVSAIATNANAAPAFGRIAKAGGGTCVTLNLGAASAKGRGAEAAPDAAEQIARHVLMLAFGQQFEPQLRAFVDTFFAYHKAGAF